MDYIEPQDLLMVIRIGWLAVINVDRFDTWRREGSIETPVKRTHWIAPLNSGA
jgi:hypothetical protein